MQEILNESKRIFIGIGINSEIRKGIYGFTTKLFGNEENIKIVPPQNIHITMKFLGDTRVQKIGIIKKAIIDLADSINEFEFEVTGEIGGFPALRDAKIVFLKIGRGAGSFLEIYEKLEDGLSSINIRKEKRRFSPHITIARIKGRKGQGSLLEREKGNLYSSKCRCITLFESKLRQTGAEYTILEEFSLK